MDIPDRNKINEILSYAYLFWTFVSFKFFKKTNLELYKGRDFSESIIYIFLFSSAELYLNSHFVNKLIDSRLDFLSIFTYNFFVVSAFSFILFKSMVGIKLKSIFSIVSHVYMSLKIISVVFVLIFMTSVYVTNPTYSETYFSYLKTYTDVTVKDLIPEGFQSDFEISFQENEKINTESMKYTRKDEVGLKDTIDLSNDYLDLIKNIHKALGFHVLNGQGWLLFFSISLTIMLFFKIILIPLFISLVSLYDVKVSFFKRTVMSMYSISMLLITKYVANIIGAVAS